MFGEKCSKIGWQEGADESQWPSFEIHPASAWNYGLDRESLTEVLLGLGIRRQDGTGVMKVDGRSLVGMEDGPMPHKSFPADNYPWTPDSVPISLKLKGRKIPDWQIDQYGLCAPVPQSPVKTTEPLEEIELIPMGAARLRISAFPVVE